MGAKILFIILFLFVIVAIASPQPIQSIETGMIPVTSTKDPDMYASCQGQYTLQRANELPAIASYCSTTVSEIYLANEDLKPEEYVANVIINLPGRGVFPGPAQESCTENECGRLTTSAGQTVFNYPGTFAYRVRKGESLAEIASRFDTNLDLIRGLNPKLNGDHIIEGQYLMLPGK